MIAQAEQGAPELEEVTGKQSVSYLFDEKTLHRDLTKVSSYSDLRDLRKDATIALGRGLLVSGILAGAWSVEADKGVSEKVIASITSILPLRESIMQAAVAFGRVDFGWMPFEKIFTIKDGRYTIERVKPLLHDMTEILIDENGGFAGFRQNAIAGISSQYDPLAVVPLEKCLHIAFDVEAGDLYGIPLLENVISISAEWDDCNEGANTYDTKVAGAHWVVHYPIGVTDIDGEATDNYDLAIAMLAALKSSGGIVMPSTVAEFVQELNRADITKLYQWNVELISDVGTKQPQFITRLKYLDNLKLRGLLIPERACTEGQYGTKAESGEHIGLAITNMQEIDKHITRAVNTQMVDQLLFLNWGPDLVGKVRLVAAPLVDTSVEFLQKLYLALTGKQVNVVALQEKLGIPLGKETADEPTNAPSND